jgi:hypothetical protein
MSNSKPSRNAFYGYTYQENITFFLLAKMDVEREIESIEMEVTEDHNFDDAKIIIRGIEYSFQMKDLEKISFKDLIITVESISIQRREHKLSKGLNILFFKDIDVINNSEIFGLPAFQKENLFIISASREFISDEIDKIYFQNENRISVIDKYFKKNFDNRVVKLKISKDDLPAINIYSTQLLEQTINVRKEILEFDNILHIEGKPGVGKSHFVNALTEEYKNNILYRFWTSSQDKDKKERLIFDRFLFDLSKKIFGDQKVCAEEEIIRHLGNEGRVVIIDGLDHVYNYAGEELNSYISFIEKLKETCRVIVLSRPLETQQNWKKKTLENWNWEQATKFLNEVYSNINYSTCREIFRITGGYPILVRYLAEHYQKHQIIPDLPELKNLEEYYDKLLNDKESQSRLRFKGNLELFILSNSFFMESELFIFDSSNNVKEYLSEYPYLFEIRLNRISLFHDSLNTYLRKQTIDNSKMIERINEIVFLSIMTGEKRFLSRFSNFSLSQEMKLKIIQKYSSIDEFERIMENAIDIEAIRSFYNQVREAIQEINSEDLAIYNYYDLALILNIVRRDHVSTVNTFLYTFVKCLLFNGYTEEDITSSEYLFGMLYFLKKNDSSLLYNLTANHNYGTGNFHERLKEDTIQSEEDYFYDHLRPMKLTKQLKEIQRQGFEQKILQYIIENIYIHTTKVKAWLPLQNIIQKYMEGEDGLAVVLLKEILPKDNQKNFLAKEILSNVKSNLAAYGFGKEAGKYRKLSLYDYILTYRNIGSFSMWIEILNYMRLSLKEERKIDLGSISLFWSMYEKRKDYSVINIDVALKAFEDKNLITEEESFEIIKFTQSMSEKGIRHLFNDYIELHSPKIINKILLKYRMEDLQIQWFDLPANFINSVPEKVFAYEMNKLIRHGNYFKTIDFEEIENVFKSNRRDKIIMWVKALNYFVKVSESNPLLDELKGMDLPLEINPDEKGKFKEDSSDRYNQGTLNSKDLDFIKKRNISFTEIAGFTDGRSYGVFSDLNVYSIYPKEELRKNIQAILYNAMIGKIRNINMFGTLYCFVGNLSRFLIDLEVQEDFEKLYRSFRKFLELSLLIDRKT